MKTNAELWDRLFALGGVRRRKPMATLYEVIVDRQDLDLAKRYIQGGHSISQRFGGGHSLALAAKHGDMEFVRYFIENAPDLDQVNTVDGAHDLLSRAIDRIASSSDDELDEAFSVLNYLITIPELEPQLITAFRACAGAKQISAAQKLISAGFEDQKTRVGPNSYVMLSDDLDDRNLSDFAALLRGGNIDIEKLQREESKLRKQNAEYKNTMSSLTLSANDPTVSGDEFSAQYMTLVKAIRDGRYDEALTSTDPHDARGVIEFAAEKGFVELVNTVMEVSPPTAKAAMGAAVAAAVHGELEVLKVLRSHKVPVQKTHKQKNSPLSEACRYGHFEIVQFLLDLGANPDAGDSSGHQLTMDDLAGGERRGDIIAALCAARKPR